MRRSLWLLLALRYACAQPLDDGTKLERRTGGDLCFINTHKMALIDDRVYFMGGEYHFDGDEAGKGFTNDNLYYFDIGENSTVQGDSIISSSSLNQISVPFDTTPTLENQTHGKGGALFSTLDSFYVFSGLGDSSTTENNVLAQYNKTSEQWSSHTVSGGNYNKFNRLFPGAASVPSTGLSFFSGGGNVGGNLANGHLPGMLRFDASNPDALTWRNETSTSNLGVAVPTVVSGNMVYVPMGEQGVIMVWGGYNGSQTNSTTGAPKYTYELLDNEKIYVYDIASASWNVVWAQGSAIPGKRAETCAVVSAAPDYSSFNIAMYGGWNLYETSVYSDTWVLSIPSFRWINMSSANYTGSNTEALLGNNYGRHQHQCAVYNDAQMIVLGGAISENGTKALRTCDAQRPPLRILNLASMSWQKSFDVDAKYTVPADVYRVIGGEGSGGATLTSPDGGFNDTTVASIFAKTVARVATTASSTSTSSSSSSDSSSTTNTGAIVGGVVGGVVGLAFLALLVFLLLRRRKRAATSQHEMVPQYDDQSHAVGGYYSPPPEKDAVELDHGQGMFEAGGRSRSEVYETDGREVPAAEMEGCRAGSGPKDGVRPA